MSIPTFASTSGTRGKFKAEGRPRGIIESTACASDEGKNGAGNCTTCPPTSIFSYESYSADGEVRVESSVDVGNSTDESEDDSWSLERDVLAVNTFDISE